MLLTTAGENSGTWWPPICFSRTFFLVPFCPKQLATKFFLCLHQVGYMFFFLEGTSKIFQRGRENSNFHPYKLEMLQFEHSFQVAQPPTRTTMFDPRGRISIRHPFVHHRGCEASTSASQNCDLGIRRWWGVCPPFFGGFFLKESKRLYTIYKISGMWERVYDFWIKVVDLIYLMVFSE